MRRGLGLLLALLPPVLAVAACSTAGEAPRGAALSTGAGAPGYLIVGIAEQNYRWDFGSWTSALTLAVTSPNQAPVLATRKGCGAGGFIGSRPCDLSRPDQFVFEVAPGVWTPTEVTLAYHLPSGDAVLRSPVVPGVPIRVGPGEVVDAGDFTFASDAVSQQIKLAQHTRSDEAARRALVGYPGLRAAPVVFRGGGER